MKLNFTFLRTAVLLFIFLAGPYMLYAQGSGCGIQFLEINYTRFLITIPPVVYIFVGFATGFFLGVVFFFRSKPAPAPVLPKSLISLSFRPELQRILEGAFSPNITLTLASIDPSDPKGKIAGRQIVVIATGKETPFDRARIMKISDGNMPAAAPAGGPTAICKTHTGDAGTVDMTVEPNGAGEILLMALDTASGETCTAKIYVSLSPSAS